MTGTDVPVNIRELAPEGLNWITLPSQATATQVPPDRTDISVEYQPNSGTQVIGPIQATM